MYQLLQKCGEPVIRHNGPMAGLYSRLGLIRLYQFISLPLVGLFCFIAFNERHDYGVPTNLSLCCIVLATMLVIFFIVLELRPLKAVQAIEVIKDLIGQEDDWEDFILWFNDEEHLTSEITRQMLLILDAGDDPHKELQSRVQKAMLVLTGHRATICSLSVCRNTDPVPGD